MVNSMIHVAGPRLTLVGVLFGIRGTLLLIRGLIHLIWLPKLVEIGPEDGIQKLDIG
jgi:hypothetical protein